MANINTQICYIDRRLLEACTLFRCWLKEGGEKRGRRQGGKEGTRKAESKCLLIKHCAALWAACFSQMREGLGEGRIQVVGLRSPFTTMACNRTPLCCEQSWHFPLDFISRLRCIQHPRVDWTPKTAFEIQG